MKIYHAQVVAAIKCLDSNGAKFILSAPNKWWLRPAGLAFAAAHVYGIFSSSRRGKRVLPKHLKQVGKIIAAIVLVIVMVFTILYGSLLRAMDQAAEQYTKGDPEAALKSYDAVEQRIRSLGAIRIIPEQD